MISSRLLFEAFVLYYWHSTAGSFGAKDQFSIYDETLRFFFAFSGPQERSVCLHIAQMIN